MDKKAKELMEKCENMDDSSVMGSCRVLLELMDQKKVEVKEDMDQTYLQMAENLKPKDVSKVLQIALKVRESGDIKDTELKNAASVLIRAIEMS
jgi:predicted transcriptional regulator